MTPFRIGGTGGVRAILFGKDLLIGFALVWICLLTLFAYQLVTPASWGGVTDTANTGTPNCRLGRSRGAERIPGASGTGPQWAITGHHPHQ